MQNGMRVGIVGVGAMGMGIAKALLAKRFVVVVRDLIPEREDEAVSSGAIRAANAAELADRVEFVITVVVDAAQTRDVLFGTGGVMADSPKHLDVMMCSTIAPADAENIAAKLEKRAVGMLD